MEDLDPTAFLATPVIPDAMAGSLPARVEGFLREFRAARDKGQLDAFIAEQREKASSWKSKD